MRGYFAILAAIPWFFLSSLFTMLFSRAIAPKLGLQSIDYLLAMLITIALWIIVAPLVGVVRRRRLFGGLIGKIMAGMMKDMMPKMMECCLSKMQGKQMGSMIPKMMECWLSKMDDEQRKGTIDSCRRMLDEMQAQHSSEEEIEL